MILLRAEGPAFCAGYGLDWATAAPSPVVDGEPERVWDSVADYRMMSRFVATYLKLWQAAKPTIAAVQGWCIGGGADMVLCADLVIAGEGARFGYPPSRVWGTRPPPRGCTGWASSGRSATSSPATRSPRPRRHALASSWKPCPTTSSRSTRSSRCAARRARAALRATGGA